MDKGKVRVAFHILLVAMALGFIMIGVNIGIRLGYNTAVESARLTDTTNTGYTIVYGQDDGHAYTYN